MGVSSFEEKAYLLLEEKYRSPTWAFFRQLRSKTEGGNARTADGIAISLWQSRGISILGFEIKASRRDWLVELKSPEKADAIARYCDQWWVVTMTRDCIQGAELPPSWGWICLENKKIDIIVEAEKLDSCPLDKEFVASVLKRAYAEIDDLKSNYIHRDEIKSKISEAMDKGVLLGKNEFALDRRQLIALKSSLDEFESKSGIRINEYNGKNIGAIVSLISGINETRSILEKATQFAIKLGETAKAVETAIEHARRMIDFEVKD